MVYDRLERLGGIVRVATHDGSTQGALERHRYRPRARTRDCPPSLPAPPRLALQPFTVRCRFGSVASDRKRPLLRCMLCGWDVCFGSHPRVCLPNLQGFSLWSLRIVLLPACALVFRVVGRS